eukprot:CAMPEP_0172476828 /NCGR_PEP_ID=MMETSP1065-20121228/70579_1 /TAXON_ID=265537 /ORGANISM="Amphiprora paludosa, Strain CCMP125" /LENGTH=239 /DNA_ID=CAMNT_0013235059 /DNA_START=86 /DNA_END=802 /DNA_ORIENTATION=-
MITGSVRKCAACETRMQSVVFASSDSSKQIVSCVACGIFAHRSCASSRHTQWKEPCPVNTARIDAAMAARLQQSETSSSTTSELLVGSMSLDGWSEEDEGGCEKKEEEEANKTIVPINDPVQSEEKMPPPSPSTTMEWTSDGPPRHWAMENPNAIVSTITIPTAIEGNPSSTGQSDADEGDQDNDEVHVTSLHHADHPFASVSRALQENIIAHFNFVRPNRIAAKEEEGDSSVDDTETK